VQANKQGTAAITTAQASMGQPQMQLNQIFYKKGGGGKVSDSPEKEKKTGADS